MRYLVLAVFAAVSCRAAIVVQARCSTPWEIDYNTNGEPGPKMFGTGGFQAAILYSAGSAGAACSSGFPSGVSSGASAAITVAPGSATGGANISVFDGINGDFVVYDLSSVSGTLWAITPGPVRPGLLDVSGTGNYCDRHYGCTPASPVSVAGHWVPGDGSLETGIPVTLGVAFPVSVSLGAGFTHEFDIGLAWSDVDAHWQFREVNGTPVAETFLVTPEPAPALLCAAGLLAAALGRKYRARRA